jgi:hypothetical protein
MGVRRKRSFRQPGIAKREAKAKKPFFIRIKAK